jgi:hypothetical protein
VSGFPRVCWSICAQSVQRSWLTRHSSLTLLMCESCAFNLLLLRVCIVVDSVHCVLAFADSRVVHWCRTDSNDALARIYSLQVGSVSLSSLSLKWVPCTGCVVARACTMIECSLVSRLVACQLAAIA